MHERLFSLRTALAFDEEPTIGPFHFVTRGLDSSQRSPNPIPQPSRRGLLLHGPRPSIFLPQANLVDPLISLYEPYQPDRIPTPKLCWALTPAKSRAAGRPSQGRRPRPRNLPGATLVILQNNWQTRTLCRYNCEHPLTNKFSVVHQGGAGIRRSDIKTNSKTVKKKTINLASLKRKLRYLTQLHGILEELNISSPPSCRGEKGRCTA